MTISLKQLLGVFLSVGVSLAMSHAEADNSLGQPGNFNTDINDRQKAEMAVPAGFVSGSSLNGVLRNYYFSRDNHNTPARLDQREWVQGAYLSFRSGYTDTPIGVGIDVHGFYGLKLDGGGGSGGAGLLPLLSHLSIGVTRDAPGMNSQGNQSVPALKGAALGGKETLL